MKPRTACLAFLLVLQAAGQLAAQGAAPAAPAPSKPFAPRGLTDGFADVIASRPAYRVRIGAEELSLESLFSKDLAAAFRCDAEIRAYLDAAKGEASYEQLAEEIENRISDSIGPYVLVEASSFGDGSLIRIGIALSLERLVGLPVSLRSADGRVSTAFVLPCEAGLEFEAEIFVDAKLTGSDGSPEGCALRIRNFELSLAYKPDSLDRSDELEGKGPGSVSAAVEALGRIPVSYGKAKFPAAPAAADFSAWAIYRLSRISGDGADTARFGNPADDGETDGESAEADILSYGDFAKGNYSWESDGYSTLDLDLTETPKSAARRPGKEARALAYSYHGHGSPEDTEAFTFFDGEKSFDLEGPAARAAGGAD
jgi:hypothetical protein